jgi:hypothetical protein
VANRPSFGLGVALTTTSKVARRATQQFWGSLPTTSWVARLVARYPMWPIESTSRRKYYKEKILQVVKQVSTIRRRKKYTNIQVSKTKILAQVGSIQIHSYFKEKVFQTVKQVSTIRRRRKYKYISF